MLVGIPIVREKRNFEMFVSPKKKDAMFFLEQKYIQTEWKCRKRLFLFFVSVLFQQRQENVR